jgi:hypothetical protein
MEVVLAEEQNEEGEGEVEVEAAGPGAAPVWACFRFEAC